MNTQDKIEDVIKMLHQRTEYVLDVTRILNDAVAKRLDRIEAKIDILFEVMGPDIRAKFKRNDMDLH